MTARKLLGGLAALAAAGCFGPGAEEPATEVVTQELRVCPKGATVEGIDVSVYQATVNWAAVKSSGRVFANARISDGVNYLDRYFAQNWSGMKAQGLIRGAYQYFRPGQDPVRQADIVVERVGRLGDRDLPVTMDVEATDGQSAATIASKMRTWIARVTAGTGKRPMIYTAAYFWNTNVAAREFAAYPLWVANYFVTCPSLPDTWSDWKFFQYTDRASVPGVSGGVDGDRFNGSLAELEAFAKVNAAAPIDAGAARDARPGDAGASDAGRVDGGRADGGAGDRGPSDPSSEGDAGAGAGGGDDGNGRALGGRDPAAGGNRGGSSDPEDPDDPDVAAKASAGCSCALPGDSRGGSSRALGATTLIALAILSRARRRARGRRRWNSGPGLLAALLVGAAAASGCAGGVNADGDDTGSEDTDPAPSGGGRMGPAPATPGSPGEQASTDAGARAEAQPNGDAGAARTDASPPAPTARIRFLPERRTFTDSLEVRLEADHTGATIYYTLDDRPPTKTSPVYTAPIRLTRSAVVRAFITSPLVGQGVVQNEGFVKLAPDAATFTSDIPILLVHSRRARPLAKLDPIVPAFLMVFAPDPKTGRASFMQPPSATSRIGIKVRGSSSQYFPKKQYKIETWGGAEDADADTALLGLPPESDFVINSGYPFDRTYVRNAFVYAVSNRIGRYAPRTRFAEVFFTEMNLDTSVGADYYGLYTLTEKIKVAKTRVAISKLRPTDLVEPLVSGGYIFKVDRANVGEMGFRAGYGPNGIWTQPCKDKPGVCGLWTWPLVFDDPDEADLAPEQKRYLARAVDDFANALANRQDYTRFIDVPSFVDHHIINILSKNPDAFRLSEFFHKDRGGKIVAGPVWDFDRTMGCAFDARVANPTSWDPSNETNDTTNVFDYGWYRGLHDDPAFKAAYWKRFRELAAGELGAARLQALVDELVGQLGKEAPARDARRWPPQAPPPSSPTAPPPPPISTRGGFADEVKLLRDWVRHRAEWMAKCLALADPELCRGV